MRPPFLTWLALALTFVLAFALGLASAPVQKDAPQVTPAEGSAPDPRVFGAVLSAVEQYHAASRTASPWQLSVDPRSGTIQSTWYSVHKGEVWLKVQASVWGQHYRVDVYQRVGLFLQHTTKTGRSAQLERTLQEHISTLLAGSPHT